MTKAKRAILAAQSCECPNCKHEQTTGKAASAYLDRGGMAVVYLVCRACLKPWTRIAAFE